MALVAELLVMAAVAILWIVQRFDGVDIDEIAAMAFGRVIPSEILRSEIDPDATSIMAVKAVGLSMALGAV